MTTETAPQLTTETGPLFGTEQLEAVNSEEHMAAFLENRTSEALQVCDFESNPDLAKNIYQFYADNFRLAGMIGEVLNVDPDQMSVEERSSHIQVLEEVSIPTVQNEALFESFIASAKEYGNMPPPITQVVTPILARIRKDRLANPEDKVLQRTELMLMAVAVESLFTEASIAVTTVGDEERATAAALAEEVISRISQSELFDQRGRALNMVHNTQTGRSVNMLNLENTQLRIDQAEELFWEDSRRAGQLLFHNSMNMTAARSNGKIMPRRMQKQLNGVANMATQEQLNDGIHSPTTHWSELYDPVTYKGKVASTRGTVAVPIWKIIETAPYARDSQYGLLTVKPDRREQILKKVVTIDTTTTIGSGSDDYRGGASLDRTFYATPHDVNPSAPLETAPDGYIFELGSTDYAVALGEEETTIAMQTGVGEGFPTIYTVPDVMESISDAQWTSLPDEESSAKLKEEKEVIAASIKTLQHKSVVESRPHDLVVALRSGLFDFYIPDDQSYLGRGVANFVKVH